MTDPEGERAVSEQYFAERPRSRSARRELRFLYRGELLSFAVDAGVFATHGLDPGTSLLIEHLAVPASARVLDLGCGWGAVGVAAAKLAAQGHVVMTDVNRRAARLAGENLERNHVRNAEVRVGRLFEPVASERFDLIASNPPFHAGRETVLQILEHAPDHLVPGGRLLLVGKGSQGIRFYQSWLADRWQGGVRVTGRGSGYRVLDASVGGPPASEAVKKATRLLGLPRSARDAPRTAVRGGRRVPQVPRVGE